MSKLALLVTLIVVSVGKPVSDQPARFGRVVDSRNHASVTGATVFVEGMDKIIRTDSVGRFFLPDVNGTVTLRARRVGYYPARGTVELGSMETMIEVGLDPVLFCLDYCPTEPTPTNGYVRVVPLPITR